MRELRISIAAIVVFLISLGIIMIYSSSGMYANENYGNPTHFLMRHLIFLGIGLLCTLGVMAMDYRDLRKIAKPLMLFTIILLVLVLIPGIGKSSFGARRWFKIGPFSFQPSELMKTVILIYMADFLARKKHKIKDFKEGFLPPMLVIGLVCSLIVVEPDLGNAVLIAGIVIIMLFIAGTRLKHLGLILLALFPMLVFLIATKPYRVRRIVAFLDPWKDSLGAGFQLSQSQIALGSGGVYGVGLGQSIQKLFYLPAAHTDFILSIVGEELGLIGTLTVVLLFTAFIWQGARIAQANNGSIWLLFSDWYCWNIRDASGREYWRKYWGFADERFAVAIYKLWRVGFDF